MDGEFQKDCTSVRIPSELVDKTVDANQYGFCFPGSCPLADMLIQLTSPLTKGKKTSLFQAEFCTSILEQQLVDEAHLVVASQWP